MQFNEYVVSLDLDNLFQPNSSGSGVITIDTPIPGSPIIGTLQICMMSPMHANVRLIGQLDGRNIVLFSRTFNLALQRAELMACIRAPIKLCSFCKLPCNQDSCNNCSNLARFKINTVALPQDKCVVCHDSFADTLADILFLACTDNKQVIHRRCLATGIACSGAQCVCNNGYCPAVLFRVCPWHPSEHLALTVNELGCQSIVSIGHHPIQKPTIAETPADEGWLED
jgi:hypothetical protein